MRGSISWALALIGAVLIVVCSVGQLANAKKTKFIARVGRQEDSYDGPHVAPLESDASTNNDDFDDQQPVDSSIDSRQDELRDDEVLPQAASLLQSASSLHHSLRMAALEESLPSNASSLDTSNKRLQQRNVTSTGDEAELEQDNGKDEFEDSYPPGKVGTILERGVGNFESWLSGLQQTTTVHPSLVEPATTTTATQASSDASAVAGAASNNASDTIVIIDAKPSAITDKSLKLSTLNQGAQKMKVASFSAYNWPHLAANGKLFVPVGAKPHNLTNPSSSTSTAADGHQSSHTTTPAPTTTPTTTTTTTKTDKWQDKLGSLRDKFGGKQHPFQHSLARLAAVAAAGPQTTTTMTSAAQQLPESAMKSLMANLNQDNHEMSSAVAVNSSNEADLSPSNGQQSGNEILQQVTNAINFELNLDKNNNNNKTDASNGGKLAAVKSSSDSSQSQKPTHNILKQSPKGSRLHPTNGMASPHQQHLAVVSNATMPKATSPQQDAASASTLAQGYGSNVGWNPVVYKQRHQYPFQQHAINGQMSVPPPQHISQQQPLPVVGDEEIDLGDGEYVQLNEQELAKLSNANHDQLPILEWSDQLPLAGLQPFDKLKAPVTERLRQAQFGEHRQELDTIEQSLTRDELEQLHRVQHPAEPPAPSFDEKPIESGARQDLAEIVSGRSLVGGRAGGSLSSDVSSAQRLPMQAPSLAAAANASAPGSATSAADKMVIMLKPIRRSEKAKAPPLFGNAHHQLRSPAEHLQLGKRRQMAETSAASAASRYRPPPSAYSSADFFGAGPYAGRHFVPTLRPPPPLAVHSGKLPARLSFGGLASKPPFDYYNNLLERFRRQQHRGLPAALPPALHAHVFDDQWPSNNNMDFYSQPPFGRPTPRPPSLASLYHSMTAPAPGSGSHQLIDDHRYAPLVQTAPLASDWLDVKHRRFAHSKVCL